MPEAEPGKRVAWMIEKRVRNKGNNANIETMPGKDEMTTTDGPASRLVPAHCTVLIDCADRANKVHSDILNSQPLAILFP